MELPIPDNVKKLWDIWNVRGCIVLSLLLQVFLVLFASSRQRFRNSLLLTFIWAAYLLADWVAPLAIGLITQSQGMAKSCDHPKGTFDKDLFAFWASFLLVHLGGPDTITSFALEDNEFWIRHFFGLILQLFSAAYSFYLTLPKNKLWPPTLLVFVVGIIKYAERVRALYLACLDRFGRTSLPEPNPGPDYEEVSKNQFSKLCLQLPIEGDHMPNINIGTPSRDPYVELRRIKLEASNEVGLLKAAHIFFERFKGLIVGFFLTTNDWKSSRGFFLEADHRCAFRIVEYELSFLFQVLHTKVVVVRRATGYILRFISLSFTLGASIYFLLLEKHGFGRFEINLTYFLLFGAIVLDSISVIKLIFSDWTLVVLKDSWEKHIPTMILRRKRWSSLVCQYNMINYCLDERPRWVYNLAKRIRAREFLDKIKIMRFSSSYKVGENLKEYIFDDLRRKSKDATNIKDAVRACQQRGDSAFSQPSSIGDDSANHPSQSTSGDYFSCYVKLKWSIVEFEYTESLLLWHIATEICLLDDKKKNSEVDGRIVRERKCKIVSDYMFYLLMMQPTLLSPVLGNWYIVFQDTFAETKRFFDKYSVSDNSEALAMIISVAKKFRPAAVKGFQSKSVFFDACILADQLLKMADARWDIMDRVWVEFMSYAAINCRPIVHAQQTSKGGELLTFTWLLMNHLGLGLQFSEQEAGAKMTTVR